MERLGTPASDREWEYAIILQGPYSIPASQDAIKIFLERNGDTTLVIVSTYPSALGNLSLWEKDIVEENHPHFSGRLVYLFNNPPGKEEDPVFWRTNYWNQNLQRFTSFMGLLYALSLGIPYSLKCRLDAFLGKERICEELVRFTDTPAFRGCDGEVLLRGRIVISEHAKVVGESKASKPIGHYFIPDFWLFGHTEDLWHYFNIGPDSPEIETNFAVETNLSRRWMKEMGIILPEGKLEELVGRFFSVYDGTEAEFVWTKRWHKIESYKKSGKKYLLKSYIQEKRIWGPMINSKRWEGLKNKYK